MTKIASFRLLLASCLAILLSASITPAQAAEQEVYRYSFQGQSIYADLVSFDNCTYTSLNLGASAGRTKTEGRPSQSSVVSGVLSQYNYCHDEYVYGYFFAELDDGALQIDRQLQTATLNTTVQACDSWCFPLTLQLTWTGTDGISREKSHYQNQSSNYKTIYRFDGETRQSTTSGSIATPLGTFNMEHRSGAIQSLKSGSMTLYKTS
jgi:hypothetical protein